MIIAGNLKYDMDVPEFLDEQARDWREVSGQLPRIFAALLFSRIWVPLGNSGRARVSAFQPMPLSEELRRLLDER